MARPFFVPDSLLLTLAAVSETWAIGASLGWLPEFFDKLGQVILYSFMMLLPQVATRP